MQGALRGRGDDQAFEQLNVVAFLEQTAFDQLEVAFHAEARVLFGCLGHAAKLPASQWLRRSRS